MSRLDGQEHEQRKLEKEVEVLFDGNLNRNDSEIFSGFFYINGNYEPPAGFKWGVFIPFEDAVVDNPESDAYNIPDVSPQSKTLFTLYLQNLQSEKVSTGDSL